MFPRNRRRHPAAAWLAPLVVVLLTLVASACGSATFDPSGPCTSDGRASGAYPDMERLIPPQFEESAPTVLDSGGNCTPTSIGSLASHGVREVRFAGGQWHLGDRSGVTMAVFRSPTGLEASWLGEFYESSARVARHTENVSATQATIGGISVFRVETLNDETSFQTVVVWAGQDAVDVVIVASDVHEVGSRAAHDARVDSAVAALAGFTPG